MTTVYSTLDNVPSREAQVGDIVYRLNSKAQYTHTAHRVHRVVNGKAVTICGVWLGFGAVNSELTDNMVWCVYGCKQTTAQEVSK